ncbi:8622_t:CDS:2 [Acaulospora morrowiae]|uniref:8622_t:CDS:1 n=1 Tax=Acaulospora morrowiae TaxID=94023 RepID=A0A9N8W4R9_9GLOM|nr:8622_t:CDS:2 [Acaulospora morrowiae]
MALPTAWNVYDKSTFLNVENEGLRVVYTGQDKTRNAAAIRSNFPILPNCGLFYFEVTIVNEGDNGIIGIGLCTKTVNLNVMPGWEDDSWGYHGDDGKCFHSLGAGRVYGPLFTTGDTIGCCLNFLYNIVFYTKNGVHLGIAFRWLEGDLYPCVGMKSYGGSIEVNFGHKKFEYEAMNGEDIDDELLKGGWNRVLFQNGNKLPNRQIDRFAELSESLPIKPNNKLLFKYRVKAYFAIGKHHKARANLVKLKYRTKAFFVMGNYKKALEEITKILEIEQNNIFALKYRGEIYHMMGNFSGSLGDFGELLKINPNDKWAYESLEEVHRKFVYCVFL